MIASTKLSCNYTGFKSNLRTSVVLIKVQEQCRDDWMNVPCLFMPKKLLLT